MSRPLILQAAMALVKGSAARQAGSSSSLKPCEEASLFIVTTQVLLRSVVESSHCPTISFFRLLASCDRAGGASASSATNTIPRRRQERYGDISGPSPAFPQPASAAACRQTSALDYRPPADPSRCALPPKPSRYVAATRHFAWCAARPARSARWRTRRAPPPGWCPT